MNNIRLQAPIILARKCEIKHWYACGADGRKVGWSVYGHVITEFSRMDRFSKLCGFELSPWSTKISAENFKNYVGKALWTLPLRFPCRCLVFACSLLCKKTVWPLCVTFVTNKKKTWGRCGQRGDTVLVQTTHSLSNSKRQGWDNNCVPHFNALKGVTSL